MKKQRTVLLAFNFLLLSLIFFSCNRDDPSEAAEVFITLITKTEFAKDMQQGGPIQINEAIFGITGLEFETAEENNLEEQFGEEEDEIVELEATLVYDVLANDRTAVIGLFSLPATTYEEIELDLSPLYPDPKSFSDQTVFISFTYTSGNETYEVEYTNDKEIEIEIKNEFDINGKKIHQILIELDLDVLLSSIDLSNVTSDEDGVIRLNANSNAAIANQIDQSIQQAFKAGEDKDEDGALSVEG